MAHQKRHKKGPIAYCECPKCLEVKALISKNLEHAVREWSRGLELERKLEGSK